MSYHRISNMALLIISAFLVMATSTYADTNNKSQSNRPLNIGTNLNGISDWSPQYPFIDYFKSSRAWISHGEDTWNTKDKLILDENGWVRSYKSEKTNSFGTVIPNDERGQRYIAFYEGTGSIEYKLGAKINTKKSSPGKHFFETNPDKPLNIRITGIQRDDYIRNIQVIPERYENLKGKTYFNPDFLESLKGYNVIRFMNWMKTNNSPLSEWKDRPLLSDATFSQKGVPLELMIALANKKNVSPWFNLPHRSTDDYIRQFANLVRDNLKPELDIYIEFSNEVWNWKFEQSKFALQKGRQQFNTFWNAEPDSHALWYAKRSVEMARIWDEVFADRNHKVKAVIASQAYNSYIGKRIVNYIKKEKGSLEKAGIDAIAIAPYFNLPLGEVQNLKQLIEWLENDKDVALSRLFKELIAGGQLRKGYAGGSLARVTRAITEYKNLSDENDVPLIAYEGGQHLVASHIRPNDLSASDRKELEMLFIEANRDKRMGEVYREYFNIWNKICGSNLFVHFSDVGKYDKWGSWGSRESIFQRSSPKYDAIRELIKQN